MEISKLKKQQRINYIDFLKCIGLTGIIIAHVGSPNWLMMLRSFDVPFMVIISSILGERSYRKYEGKGVLFTVNYYISRVKRLVLPTWMFLTFYFAFCFLRGEEFQGMKYYIYSYCLTRYGIDYVWVILIYLYSALLIPVFSKIKLSVKNVIIIVMVYSMYELIYHFQIGISNKFFDTIFYYIIPYGVLTFLGYHFYRMSKKARLEIVMTAILIFVAIGIYYWIINGVPQPVQIAKYPPRLYYLGYGIAWSFLLLMFCERHNFKIYDNPIIRYISVHSMGIYLWHILALNIYHILELPDIWYVKLIVVYMTTIITVFVLNHLLNLLQIKK